MAGGFFRFIYRTFIIGILFIFGKVLSDSIFLRLRYFLEFGHWPNLKHPQTFNEKLQWLKLYDRNPIYTKLVDKIEVKKWVAEKIGSEYIIPTLELYNKAEEINFKSLPNEFVLKCNHDSGGLFICTDKSKLNQEEIKGIQRELNKTLRKDYYILGREWPYKNVRHKILAEQYMVDETGCELKDYKIFCFNGEPKFIQVDFGRFSVGGHKRNLYDVNWNLLSFEYGYPADFDTIIEKPSGLDEMLRLASSLSEGIPFIRVDFYYINEDIKSRRSFIYSDQESSKIPASKVNMKLGNSKYEIYNSERKERHGNSDDIIEKEDSRPHTNYSIYFGELTFYPGCGFEKFKPFNYDNVWGGLLNIGLNE